MRKLSLVVGGGAIGCAIALRLAQRGFAPLVIERGVPGAEASSAAAGILAPQKEAEGPGALLDLGLRSRALYPALVDELRATTGVDVGYRESGLLSCGGIDEEPGLIARAAWQETLGLRARLLSLEEARRIEPALGPCTSALLLPDEAQIDPPKLVYALQLAAARAGAEFISAEVRRICHDGQRVEGVALAGETIESPIVVVAAGAWSALVDGAALPAGAVRPVRGQMVELAAPSELVSRILFAPGGYLVPRSDGRIAVGSTSEEVGFRKEVTVAGLASLLALAQRMVPALAGAPVRRFWAGFRPATDDLLPLLGPTLIRGLHLATGHFRNGILLAPITAEAVVAAIAGERPPIDLAPFSVARLGR